MKGWVDIVDNSFDAQLQFNKPRETTDVRMVYATIADRVTECVSE